MTAKYDKTPIGQAKKEAKIVAERYRSQLKDLRKHFGTRPWDSVKLSPTEKLAAYAQVREDPEFWQSAVHLEGRKLNLSDGVLPRSVIEDAAAMETKYHEAVKAGTLPGPDALPTGGDAHGN